MSWKYMVWHVGNGYIAEHGGYATKKDAEEYGIFFLEMSLKPEKRICLFDGRHFFLRYI